MSAVGWKNSDYSIQTRYSIVRRWRQTVIIPYKPDTVLSAVGWQTVIIPYTPDIVLSAIGLANSDYSLLTRYSIVSSWLANSDYSLLTRYSIVRSWRQTVIIPYKTYIVLSTVGGKQ